MRHYTSTLYAILDISEDRAFYRHMGHSKAINETIHQTPPAEIEIQDVGSVLNVIGWYTTCTFQVIFKLNICYHRI